LTLDFHTNKRVVEEIAIIPTKRLRNQIAGFITHLMKRIQAGPVRGISIKLQEEERERRDNYVPEVSALEPATMIAIDQDTRDMLNAFDFKALPNVGVQESNDQQNQQQGGGNQRGGGGDRQQGGYARRGGYQ